MTKIMYVHNKDEELLAQSLAEDIRKFLNASNYIGTITIVSSLSNYPWINDLDHLTRVNRYRKRVRQHKLMFRDDDVAELALIGTKTHNY